MEIKLAPESIGALANTAEGIVKSIADGKSEASKLCIESVDKNIGRICDAVDKFITLYANAEIARTNARTAHEEEEMKLRIEREKLQIEREHQDVIERKAEWELKDLRKKLERAKLEQEIEQLRSSNAKKVNQ